LPRGQDIKVFWRGKPIYIMKRTKKQIEESPRACRFRAFPSADGPGRVKEGHDQWLVVIGICTHLGCIPIAHEGKLRRASSAPATARNTTPQAAFGRDQRRPTWRCRPTNFVSDSKIQIG